MTEHERDPAALIRVALIDDQAMIRGGLRMMLEHEPDVTVVGEAGDGSEVPELVASARPDVVLMDIRMPRVDGLEATRRLRASDGPQPAVLVLTTFDDDEYVFGALRAGASGFLLKDASPDELIAAVRTVAAGDALVAPAVTARLVADWVAKDEVVAAASASGTGGGADGTGDAAPAWPHDPLSAREQEILIGLARGRSNRDLAADLFVSEATVKTHVSNLLTKLGVASRVQAVIAAYELGVVRPGDLNRDAPG